MELQITSCFFFTLWKFIVLWASFFFILNRQHPKITSIRKSKLAEVRKTNNSVNWVSKENNIDAYQSSLTSFKCMQLFIVIPMITYYCYLNHTHTLCHKHFSQTFSQTDRTPFRNINSYMYYCQSCFNVTQTRPIASRTWWPKSMTYWLWSSIRSGHGTADKQERTTMSTNMTLHCPEKKAPISVPLTLPISISIDNSFKNSDV